MFNPKNIRRRRIANILHLFITALIFSLAIELNESAPSTDPFSNAFSISSTSGRKTLDQEVGSPSELAWQAWLLVENKQDSQSPILDSSGILRRITPKSIFIAPDLVSCSNGYSPDSKGVCKPDTVKIDEDAQKQFVLNRLNFLFSKFGGNRKKPGAPTGPLQINIPLSLPEKPSPETESQKPHQENGRFEIPIAPIVPPQTSDLGGKRDPSLDDLTIVKLPNDTGKDKFTSSNDKNAFFFDKINSSANGNDSVKIHVVSVPAVPEEANRFTGIVDYNIPTYVKPHYNDQRNNETNAGNYFQQDKISESFNTSEDSSPNVILLLPTKVPASSTPNIDKETSLSTSTIQANQNFTYTKATGDYQKISNSDENWSIPTVAPLETHHPDAQRVESEISSTQKPEESDDEYSDEDSHTEVSPDDRHEYDETTEPLELDDFTDSDEELLKAGEAGTMLSKNQKKVGSDNRKRHKEAQDYHTSTIQVEEQATTMASLTSTDPEFQINPTEKINEELLLSTVQLDDSSEEEESTDGSDRVTTTVASTDSSILDTTILDDMPTKRKQHLEPTVPTSSISTHREPSSDIQKPFENHKPSTTEPTVPTEILPVSSTPYYIQTFIRPTHPIKLEKSPEVFGEDIISRTEIPTRETFDFTEKKYGVFPTLEAYHLPERKNSPIIRFKEEPIFTDKEGSIPLDFKDQIADSFKLLPNISPLSPNDELTYVKFPESSRVDESHHQDYVRFPSDEINSIHNLDYKDINPYRSGDEYNSQTSTKSSILIPIRQKNAPLPWRTSSLTARSDRQHQMDQPISLQFQVGGNNNNNSNNRQKPQKPTYLRYWSRLPVVRADHSFYPTTSHGSHNEPIGGERLHQHLPNVRRHGHPGDSASEDVDRLLMRRRLAV